MSNGTFAEPIRPLRSLLGKVAIVTGAGADNYEFSNGRAIAILLAEDGASVVCMDLQPDRAERTAELIRAEGKGSAVAIQGDVTIEDDCYRVVDTAVKEFGRLDILVNNVGIIGAKGTAVETDVVAWAKGMEVNVASMMLMVKYAVAAMLANERLEAEGQIRGSIVNLGSVAGLLGGTPSLLYPTSKGAVVNMTRAMAAHHARDGIRVNCVCPGMSHCALLYARRLLRKIPMLTLPVGMLYTPMMYRTEGMNETIREARRKRSLLQTEGNAWDCAGPVRFLAGNEARWMTGSVITVDAGATCASFMPAE